MKHHLASAITAINSFTDPESLAGFLRTLADHLPIKLATIWKINRCSDTVSALARIIYQPSPEQPHEFVHSYSNSFIGKVTRELESNQCPYIMVSNIQQHPYWETYLSRDRAQTVGLKSLVVIPARNYVLSRTAPIPTALLNLYADDGGSEIDEPLAKTISNTLSTILSQHTLVSRADITASVLRYYAENLTNLSTIQLLEGLVPEVLRRPYMRVEGASIYIWDAFRAHLSLAYSTGLASGAIPSSVSEFLSTGITGEAACQRRPIIIDDLQSEASIEQSVGRSMPFDEAHRHLEAAASPPRSLMAIPIYNPSRGDQATGVIRLINKKNLLSEVTDTFDDEDVLLMEHFARLLLFQIESAQWETARQRAAHDLDGFVRVIKASSEKIASHAETLGLGNPARNWIDDIRSSAEDIDRLTRVLSGVNLAEVKRVGWDPRIELSREALKGDPPQWSDLRHNFSRVFRPHGKGQEERGLRVEYTGPMRGPFIRMHESGLREVLSALYSNAAKYAQAGTTIVAVFRVARFAAYFRVRNLGHALEEGERYRMFRNGFRGMQATIMGIEGQGRGLYVARAICELYGAALDYEPHESSVGGLVWHEFVITFPMGLLRLE